MNIKKKFLVLVAFAFSTACQISSSTNEDAFSLVGGNGIGNGGLSFFENPLGYSFFYEEPLYVKVHSFYDVEVLHQDIEISSNIQIQVNREGLVDCVRETLKGWQDFEDSNGSVLGRVRIFPPNNLGEPETREYYLYALPAKPERRSREIHLVWTQFPDESESLFSTVLQSFQSLDGGCNTDSL